MEKRFGPARVQLGRVLLWLLLAVFLGSAFLVNPAAAFRFVFLGDSRIYEKPPYYDQTALKDLLREAKKHHPDFVVFGGDMARWGGTDHLQGWLAFMKHASGGIKLYPVKGNHEIHTDQRKSIQDLDEEYNRVFHLQRANYVFTHGQKNKTLFVVLDTSDDRDEQNRDIPHISPGQLDWLEGHLKHPWANQVIVIGHAPVKPMHGPQKSGSMKKLESLLKKYPKVALYLSGHDHNYQENRLNAHVTQVISGNAGANATAPWCFLVVDVEQNGVHFTGYRGKHGKYAPVPH